VVRDIENGGRGGGGGLQNKADMCQEFRLVNSMIPIFWENRAKIISMFEQSRSGTKQFRKPE
jgi:hypothetical protein